MAAIAIFSALTMYLQFLFTRERITEETMGNQRTADVKTVSMGEQLKAVTSEKWWWIVIAFCLSFQWAGAVKKDRLFFSPDYKCWQSVQLR